MQKIENMREKIVTRTIEVIDKTYSVTKHIQKEENKQRKQLRKPKSEENFLVLMRLQTTKAYWICNKTYRGNKPYIQSYNFEILELKM